MDAKNKFEVLSGRDQILKKPTMWIGAIDPTEKEMFVIENDKVEYKTITYIPALRKLIDEILDNSLDALIEHRNSSGTIKVKIDEEKVSVEDDGPGIPVVKKQLTESEEKSLPKEEVAKLKDSYIPYIAWTRLFSGTNFQESENKTNIGSHGVGSKAAAIFSTKFTGTTDDGKKKCIVKTSNNLEKSSCKVESSSGKSGTTVEFYPDLPRFKLEKITQVYQDLTYQRLLCLAITFPKMKFYFNGKKIIVNDKKFLNMFSDNIEFVSFDKGFVGIYPNVFDDFKFLTYVDGMYMDRGGNHIEYICSQIVNPIRDKLVKKYKTLKPADIRNRFTLVCFLREFPNPKFDSQTKDTLTNSQGDITAYLNGCIDFEKFSKNILKNDALINPIIETFKIKEELKARQELKSVKKIKVKSDKYMAPIGEQKYLALCEGASAMSGISSCLGRNGIGYYAMRGLPLNAYDSTMQKIVANAELKDIINILGLDISKTDTNKTIEFEKILITTDADCYAENTLVVTNTGLKEIKDITYSDLVMSSNGEFRPVVDIITKHTNELLIINIDGGYIITTPTQKMFVCRDGEIIEIFAKDVKTTDFLLKQAVNLKNFDLVPIKSVKMVTSPKEETLYDITVDGDHTFFIHIPGMEINILAHNCDGSHITSMLIGWFKRFAPNLFAEGKVCKLITPNVILEDSHGKVVKYFMSLQEFKKWEINNRNNKYKIVYLKGLGSWDREQLIELIEKNGLSNFIIEYHLDKEGNTYIEDWLGPDSEKRKKYLREYTFDIDQA